MAYTTIATIYDTPEVFQTLIIEFEFMYTGAKNIVTYCASKIPLVIKASDLEEDIRVAVAEELHCEPYQVELTTEIDFPL